MTHKFIITLFCLIATSATTLNVLACDPAANGAHSTASAPPPDFGDRSSQTLTTKSWDALAAKNYAHVLAFTSECINLYASKAVEMQNELSQPAPAETASQLWALNDVGACLYIRGMAYEGMGKNDSAMADYKKLLDKVSFAQVWDPQGWFWKPADAAQQRLDVLAFDIL